ncbi:conserved rodent malaria protein, unknown function [Plasmodium chabaudi chabaudi]|uniref:CIR protein n=1 Tax=Plasmodium chabaudi chabaudi TaxID=31271 RepID=A0A1D3L6T8_PLACU|nr:conserved rodent malaria protein, unknown function [Plasmodium chabaudi chabaudi]
MSQYYHLFQQISYVIVKYPKNNPNVQGIKNDSTIFYNKHTSLYNDVNECDSYHIPSIKQQKQIVTVGFNCEKCKKGQLSNQENISESSDSGQHNSSSEIKEQGDNIIDKPEQSQDDQQQTSGSKHETSSDALENGNNDLGGQDIAPKNSMTQKTYKSITGIDSLRHQEDLWNIKRLLKFLIDAQNTFEKYRAPFYKAFTNIEQLKKAHKTKAFENIPASKENEPEPGPSLSEPENIQTPIPVGQSNATPQASLPTQNIGSPNSKQVNPSDSPSEKQLQPLVDPSSKTPSLNIEKGSTGTNVEDKTPQLVNSIDIFKGYNRPEIVVTVLFISIIL